MKKKPLALVVDDEKDLCELVELTLSRMQIGVRTANTLGQAREMLQHEHFDLCLTDMKLPDGDGLDFVELIQRSRPNLPVAVITAHGSMETAIRALKSGAFDFVTKPVDIQVLRKVVHSALELGEHDRGAAASRTPQGLRLLGESAAIFEIRGKIAKLARSQAPIFIGGESGTGKELVARLIHAQSHRSSKPFVAVNCGAIPPELMESEFFGYRKGSFTGANQDKEGLFQAAEGGSLFLDEVADLPSLLQVKLLRAIQEKSVRPIGTAQELPVDVRIISATHKDLGALVQQGQFRQDLFYRINVIELRIPPLRERRGDIPLLIDNILHKLAAEHALALAPRLAPAALEALTRHDFPGNVRELENILQRALALCEGSIIDVDDLGLPSAESTATPIGHLGAPATHAAQRPEPPVAGGSLESYIDEVERRKIMEALEKTRWNKTAAARELGITFRALRYRLKKLGLE